MSLPDSFGALPYVVAGASVLAAKDYIKRRLWTSPGGRHIVKPVLTSALAQRFVPSQHTASVPHMPKGRRFTKGGVSRRGGASAPYAKAPFVKKGFVAGHPVTVVAATGAVKQEMKYKDHFHATATELSTHSSVSPGYIVPCFATATLGIGEGTGPSSRIGRCIYLNKILASIALEFKTLTASTTSSCHNYCRFMLVEDTQCNGTIMVISDLLERAATAQEAYDSQLNMATVGRYIVHRDRRIYVDPPNVGNGTSQNGSYKSFKFNKRFVKEKKIEYNKAVGSDGTLDELSRSNFYMIFISVGASAAAAPENLWVHSFSCRTRYSG